MSSGLEPQGAADPHSGAVNGDCPWHRHQGHRQRHSSSDRAGTHARSRNDGLVRKAVVIRSGDTLSVAFDPGRRLARGGGGRNRRLPRGSQSAQIAGRPDALPRVRAGERIERCTPRLASHSPSMWRRTATSWSPAARMAAFSCRAWWTGRSTGFCNGRSGTIDSSLYVSARAAGMPNQVLMEMVHIFSFDVDFQREIQRGNRFEVLYEAVFNRDGEFVENGPILYARSSRSASARWNYSATSPTRGRRTISTLQGCERAQGADAHADQRRSALIGLRRAQAPDPRLQQEALRASISRRLWARRSTLVATGRSR